MVIVTGTFLVLPPQKDFLKLTMILKEKTGLDVQLQTLGVYAAPCS
jgi:hypothetical protein